MAYCVPVSARFHPYAVHGSPAQPSTVASVLTRLLPGLSRENAAAISVLVLGVSPESGYVSLQTHERRQGPLPRYRQRALAYFQLSNLEIQMVMAMLSDVAWAARGSSVEARYLWDGERCGADVMLRLHEEAHQQIVCDPDELDRLRVVGSTPRGIRMKYRVLLGLQPPADIEHGLREREDARRETATHRAAAPPAETEAERIAGEECYRLECLAEHRAALQAARTGQGETPVNSHIKN